MQVERHFHRVTALLWHTKQFEDSKSWVHDLTVVHEDGKKSTCIAFIGKKCLDRPTIIKPEQEDVWSVSDESAIWVEDVKVEKSYLEKCKSFVTKLVFSGEGSSYYVNCYSEKELPVYEEVESANLA